MNRNIIKWSFLGDVIRCAKLNKFKRLWRKSNQHNSTRAVNIFWDGINNINVGRYSYGDLKVIRSDSKSELHIGDFVSIAPEVTFVLDSEHNIDTMSTFPFKSMVLGINNPEVVSKGDIIVEDDVWIGHGAIILAGVRIVKGSIVAAGSVVTKDIPPCEIWGGNPAKKIKDRFDSEEAKNKHIEWLERTN